MKLKDGEKVVRRAGVLVSESNSVLRQFCFQTVLVNFAGRLQCNSLRASTMLNQSNANTEMTHIYIVRGAIINTVAPNTMHLCQGVTKLSVVFLEVQTWNNIWSLTILEPVSRTENIYFSLNRDWKEKAPHSLKCSDWATSVSCLLSILWFVLLFSSESTLSASFPFVPTPFCFCFIYRNNQKLL